MEIININNELVSKNNTNNTNAFYILCSIYIASILCGMTVSARIITLNIPFSKYTCFITGGTFIIPIAFFAQDIITEIFGYHKAKQTLILSMIIVSFFVSYLYLLTKLSCPIGNTTCNSYNTIGKSIPRHLFAFLVSFSIGNISNNLILSKLKKAFNGQHLAFRFIFSTAMGELILQLVGTTIAWFGNMHFTAEIIPFIIISFSYKILFEVLMTPVNILICNKLR
jgi:uncharacterized integral membrane protein (TIGR00697 family)